MLTDPAGDQDRAAELVSCYKLCRCFAALLRKSKKMQLHTNVGSPKSGFLFDMPYGVFIHISMQTFYVIM